MKTKLAVLLVLLAMGGSLRAQQIIVPVAGVATLDVSAGRNSFKVLVNQTITSTVFVNPQPGQVINVLFQEVSGGGFTVAFGGNIGPGCAVATGSGASTGCQFQYDAGSNTWTSNSASAGSPAGPNQALQLNNGGAFGASGETDDGTTFATSRNTRFKGPNPYVDITAFGAVAGNPNSAPFASGITASINSGQTTATLSSASTFANGNGVTIYGAGADSQGWVAGATAMAAPTVTPSISIGGTGTGLVANSAAGATTICYKVVARDTGGGFTAASPETCPTTTQTLGATSLTISAWSRSGTTITFTTSAPHPINVGCTIATCGEVEILSATDNSVNGWYLIASAADTTHFTVGSNVLSTTNGATTSGSNGTAVVFLCNHIVVTAPAIGTAWEYWIYKGATGAETRYGISRPQGSANTDLTFDDFGSTMMGSITFPPFMPVNAPASPGNDNLTTTISSGGGTTTLTLANAASATVAGATIRIDDGPAFIAAATAANGSANGAVRIPADANGNPFVVNSFTDLRTFKTALSQSGSLYLNETLVPPTSNSGNGGVRWHGGPDSSFGAACGVNSWGPWVTVSVAEANPGVYMPTSFQTSIGELSFNSLTTNGGLLFLAEGGFTSSYENLCFITGNGGNSNKMGYGLYLRGSNGQSATKVVMDRVGFDGGDTLAGDSHNFPFLCNGCASVHMREVYNIHRGYGFMDVPSGTGGFLQIENGYYNGGGTPEVSWMRGSGTVVIGSMVMDTVLQPCVAQLANTSQAFVIMEIGGCGNTPTVPGLTGNFASVQGVNPMSLQSGGSAPNAQTANSLVQSGGGAHVNGGFQLNYALAYDSGASRAVDQGDTMFVMGAPPSAPSCSVSAGGSVALGTYTFEIVPVWWNSSEGVYSLPSASVTTTTGNQTITCNWSAVPGNPKGVNLYWNSGGGFGFCGNCGGTLSGGNFAGNSTTSGAITTAFGTAGVLAVSVPAGGPTMLIGGTQGIASPQLTIAGTPFVSTTLPTISTHFNTSGDSIAATSNASFLITVGTGVATSTGALTLPTAPNGWNCTLTNKTRADVIQQSGDTTTSATFTNFGTTFAATNWTNSDVLYGSCFPR